MTRASYKFAENILNWERLNEFAANASLLLLDYRHIYIPIDCDLREHYKSTGLSR